MRRYKRVSSLLILYFTALVIVASADQKAKNADSPLHLVTCRIEKVSECLAQEASAGYVAIHVAASIMDRSRSPMSNEPGFGIWRSEDPVLVTMKSSTPKRQTVAIIDDLARREQQLNQAGAAGMRLLPNEITALRSWAGTVSVDGYVALLEEASPLRHFEYKIVDVADKAVSDRLKILLSDGYRAVAFVPPAIIVMERGSENTSRIDEYQVLQGFDAQHVGSELTKAATPGFRVITAGISPSGMLTTVVLEHLVDDKQITEYQVFSGNSGRDLEKRLNETAQQGYSLVYGSILPINANKWGDRGMTAAPQRVCMIVGKPTAPKYSAYRVLDAFGRDHQSRLDSALKEGYEFLEFVSLATDNFIILGRRPL